MDEFIKREAAIAIIEEKQKELCPVGRYGRGYVYGSDREKYDAWDEIIDALENIPAADVAPVVHASWDKNGYCTNCKKHAPFWSISSCYYKSPYCQSCGAKMEGGATDDA